MADHPLIGVGANDVPFLLGSRILVWDVVRVFKLRNGTASEVADVLGIGKPAVDAAVAYWDDLSPVVQESIRKASEAAPSSTAESKSTPERITQVFALFAGLTTIVYLTGGLVLATRLALADIPWQPVVAQLPREFLIGVGVSQVLLPALIVATAYAGWRLLQRPVAPKLRPWAYDKDDAGTRRKNRLRFALVGLYMAVPMFLLVLLAILGEELDDETVDLLVGEVSAERFSLGLAAVVVLVCAIIGTEARARQAEGKHSSWHSLRSGMTMTGLYAALSVPVSIFVCSSVFSLSEAKLCTTQGFAEFGDLIGQSGDGVYLGERPSKRARRLGRTEKRIAVFPHSQVEELFIGPVSGEAQCDPRSAQGVVEASSRRTEVSKAANAARVAASDIGAATSVADAVMAAKRGTKATRDAVNGTRAAANVVARTLYGRARRLWDAADHAMLKAYRLARSATAISEGRAGTANQRTRLALLAADAAEAAERADLITRRAVRALLRAAKKAGQD